MAKELRTSLLIPTLNAGEEWPAALEGINDQSYRIQDKIIVDSGSADDTVTLAKQFGFRIIDIEKKDFNHGTTRQLLVNSSHAPDICVFLTQDAILASSDSIKNLIGAFDDPEVGVAYGRQLPHKNARSLEKHARLFNYPATSAVHSLADRHGLGFKVCFCSNSFAAYRKSALNEVGGFTSDSIMGEDAIVAGKMLLAGFKKAYVADATVYHSHSYTLAEEFKRYFDTRVFHEQNRWLIDEFGKPTGEGFRYLNSELAYVARNDFKSIIKSLASMGAKWAGYKMGKYYGKMPGIFLEKLSMHKYYWQIRPKG